MGRRLTETAGLADALRKAVTEVDSSARRRAEYSSDASNYRVVPQLLAFPDDAGEVAVALAAAGHGTPVTVRGGGTSTAGNAVGPGLVLDCSRHMNCVVSIEPQSRTAVVQPGATLDDITAAGPAHGLRFGPDPSTHARATIGGSIGNNACGSRALRYGRTADNVVALDVLTSDGSRLVARRFGREGLAAVGPAGAALDELVRTRLGLIRREFGRFRRQVPGYSLEHLLPENGADLARFPVGTEGTLGVVAEATVTLVESPPAVALAVLGYPDMPAAAEAVLALLPHRPVALEGMDARLVEVVRARREASAVPPLPRGADWLVVETPGADQAEAKRLIADSGCLDSTIVPGAPARALWRIREDGAGLGGRTPANQPAWPGWEDAAVPPERLPAYLREFAGLMMEHRVDGLVGRHGGSLSGEHGDGRARDELLRHMYSAEAIATFAAVKRIFDPGDLLNPGVIAAPAPLDADLRLPQAHSLNRSLGFAYPHDRGDLSVAVHRCVGVGQCRADSTASGGVMCPSCLATRDEKDSTRGRARVLQELANGTLIGGYAAPEVHQALDLCLSCKGCSSDCPAGVDMATYKAEVLHQAYRRGLRPRAHYSLGGHADADRAVDRRTRLDCSRPVRCRSGRAAALPSPRHHGLVTPTPRCSLAPVHRSSPSADAAGWPETSEWSKGTARCRWPWLRQHCCRASGQRHPTP